MKKIIPLTLLMLIISSCNNVSSSVASESNNDSSALRETNQSIEQSSEKSVSSTSVDEFDSLSNDARRLAEALKKESRDHRSYFKLTVHYRPGGISLTEKFAYHFPEQIFVISTHLIDTEDNVEFNGYVMFEWGKFFNGIFGGNYVSGEHYIQDIRFTEMTYSGLDFNWKNAYYGETSYPENEPKTNMIARIDLAFQTLQNSIYFADEYLSKAFNPRLYLF